MSQDNFTLDGLKVEDEKILEEMDQTKGDKQKYYQLVAKRHELFLRYENLTSNHHTKYLINTMRQSIFTQVQLSKLEEQVANLTSRLDNSETKT